MAQNIVSILVPIYKVPEHYLRACIESLMGQTLTDIEILLIDDGSPDQCGRICDEYAQLDKRIHVIHQENRGLCGARNAGLDAATGQWVMLVDGDDWLSAQACEDSYRCAVKSDVDLVMFNIVKEYTNTSMHYHIDLEEGRIYEGDACKELQARLLLLNGNIACAFAKLYKRSFLEKHQFRYDEKLRQGVEALEFNLRVFDRLNRAVFLNKPYYHYVFNQISISASYDEANNQYVIKCMERIKDLIVKSDNQERLTINYYNRLLHIVLTTAISGYFNPENPDDFQLKVEKFKTFLNTPIFQEALEKAKPFGLSITKRITLFFIRSNRYRIVSVIAKFRRKQLINR